jgi:hypothetical protein
MALKENGMTASQALPDAETARQRRDAVRRARGYLLPNQGVMAAALAADIDAGYVTDPAPYRGGA